ncbi:MAG: pentapeptide repeat-containing protein, partial [Elusimicrobiales bacterium]|nr:pentapeptide repeat-containing protein [Elusimicrobiales bacterium]
DLSKANLIKTDLRGTNFFQAKLDEAELNYAEYSDTTTLPFSEEEAKKRGMIKVSN